MNCINFKTVIDVSSIIWNTNDYDDNEYHYFDMINGVSDLFKKLTDNESEILLRNELLDQMINGFPFLKLPNKFYDVGNLVYSFLSKVGNRFISYPNNKSPNLVSIPNQEKRYYNDTTKEEIKYLLTKIHTGKDESVFFTFQYLWDDSDKLKTQVKTHCKEYKTIISDKDNGLDVFFDGVIPKFEHNPKHNKRPGHSKRDWENAANRDNIESWLSCYNGNKVEPQRLLDHRYPKLFGTYYYSYDNNNHIYVVFRQTRCNIFHGYDEYNIEKIPEEIKHHFNIWKYKWHC